jgi:hypothetical protein
MARDVDAVVVAVAAGGRPGRVAYAANGLGALHFELNDFVVENAIKGAATGETLTVERAGGGPDAGPSAGGHDGGPYKEGQRYLLFLRRQSSSPYLYLVHPEGRYSVEDDDRLTTEAEGPVATRLYGQSLREVAALLQAAAGTP